MWKTNKNTKYFREENFFSWRLMCGKNEKKGKTTGKRYKMNYEENKEKSKSGFRNSDLIWIWLSKRFKKRVDKEGYAAWVGKKRNACMQVAERRKSSRDLHTIEQKNTVRPKRKIFSWEKNYDEWMERKRKGKTTEKYMKKEPWRNERNSEKCPKLVKIKFQKRFKSLD